MGANHNIQLGNTSALSMMPLNPQHIGSTELDVDSKLLASSNPLSTDTIALGSSHYIIFPEQSQAPSVEPSFSELSLPKALEPPSSIKSNSYDLKRSEKIKVDSASEKKDSNITSKNIQTNSVERERKTVEIVTLQSNHTNRRSGNTNIYTKEIRRSSDSDSKKNKGSPIQKTNARTSSISKSTPSSPRGNGFFFIFYFI